MTSVYSNGGSGRFVRGAFERLCSSSTELYLATPYFTYAQPVAEAADLGKPVSLIVGLNEATSARALRTVFGRPGVSIRYFTNRFHAKIFLFDDSALVGSANLTDGGMQANREAVIHLAREQDGERLDEIRSLFEELWSDALVLTSGKLDAFEIALRRLGPPPQFATSIEGAVGKAEPRSIDVESRKPTRARLFEQSLDRQIYEEYLPAFNEVRELLVAEALLRPEVADLNAAQATNRFLNWVRRVHAPNVDDWKSAPFRDIAERRLEIRRLGEDWLRTSDHRIAPVFFEMLGDVNTAFASKAALDASTKDQISAGLLGLHAFREQLRFTSGGRANLAPAFWARNGDNIERVKKTIGHLLFGPGEFVKRLHDVLYDRAWKLDSFGLFCSLELYGTVAPDQYPPINGRMAKALRFLGFHVRTS